MPICMEIGIDRPMRRSSIDLHHWKHSSSTLILRKTRIGSKKEANVPSNLFMRSSGNVKLRRKETQRNMGDVWNELNEIILLLNAAAGESSTHPLPRDLAH